jgi:menaquinone-dependent protoporphyrinogen oxidase
MASKILVSFATRSGSTQEVAEAVATAFRDAGKVVDLQPMRNVQTLIGYRLVILGAPLYMFRWHKDARAFLSRHKEVLKSISAAVFALGPFHNEEAEWQGVRAQLDKELAKFPWFIPVAREVFGGKFDPKNLRFPMSLIPAIRKMPASDIRDWTAIRTWAHDISTKL